MIKDSRSAVTMVSNGRSLSKGLPAAIIADECNFLERGRINVCGVTLILFVDWEVSDNIVLGEEVGG